MNSTSSNHRVFVVGVGMTKFEKPGRREWDYPDMAREAGRNALADAGISFEQVQEAFAGYVYGDSCAGERAVYELGEYMPLTLELTVHIRARPAPGALLGRVKTRHLRDGYHEEDLDLWDSKGTLVSQSRQLALLPKLEPRDATK